MFLKLPQYRNLSYNTTDDSRQAVQGYLNNYVVEHSPSMKNKGPVRHKTKTALLFHIRNLDETTFFKALTILVTVHSWNHLPWCPIPLCLSLSIISRGQSFHYIL